MALLRSGTRLISLTGPGGCGKTRLAVAVASEALGNFEDGVWWVGLASLSSPDLVPQMVAKALDVREQPHLELAEALAGALRDKHLLLVLDNCEHLIEACAWFAHTMLTSCRHLRILATSREALGVAGEAVWRVPSLTVPEVGDSISVEGAARYEGVRLFVERSRAKLSTFDLTPENTRSVAEVCRKLDGIPLAIELAAARVPMLSVAQISEKLENPLELLSAGDRTAEPRQRTLRATLAWSYDLLDEPEQVLMRRLSTFAGGWTMQAAEAVCAGEGIEREAVLDLLSRLGERSLVVVGKDVLPYRMLEPVRQYAMELLVASGEAARFRERHAQYCLELAERAEPELGGPRQGEWLERLEREHDNIRAALQWWLVEGQGGEQGLRLAGALERFWWVGGYLGEGRGWLEKGIEGDAAVSVRAKALCDAGWMALYQDDLGRAVDLLEEGVGLFEELGDERGIATSLFNLGHAVLHQGDNERLETLCQEARVLRRRFVDRWSTAELTVLLGMAALYDGDHETAATLLEESMASFREMGDTQRVTLCITHLWIARLEGGDHELAAALLGENLRLLQTLGIKPRIYNDLLGSAVIAAFGGQPARAVRLWGAAEALRESIGLAIVLWDHVPTDYEGHLAATRSRLGDETFEAAWEEGRAMTPEQAVEYALKTEEPSPAQDSPPYPSGLSAREAEVLALVSRGLTNAQVAKQLFISPRTVNRHLNSIYHKIGVGSRAAATRFAAEHNLL